MAITIPNEYGYVLASALSMVLVNHYHSVLTNSTRSAAKIKYPQCYAEAAVAEKDSAAYKFNCSQRAHANYTENLTPVLLEVLVAGLRFPVVSAVLGAGWTVSRVVYAWGYVNKGPKGRSTGATSQYLSVVPLTLMSLYTSVSLALGQ